MVVVHVFSSYNQVSCSAGWLCGFELAARANVDADEAGFVCSRPWLMGGAAARSTCNRVYRGLHTKPTTNVMYVAVGCHGVIFGASLQVAGCAEAVLQSARY